MPAEPTTDETQDEFIARCARYYATEEPDRTQDQALAICYKMWDEAKGQADGKSFQRFYLEAKMTQNLEHRKQQQGQYAAAKSIGDTRFGGYLILWGSPAQKDLGGEYFTKATKGYFDVFNALGKLPAIYHHSGHEGIKSTVIGVIDVMKEDDVGIYIEAEATKARAYRQFVAPLLDQGLLGLSSGTFPRARQVAKSGEITYWPVIEGSLTPTPMDQRMVNYPVQFIKSIYDQAHLDFGAVKSLVVDPIELAEKAAETMNLDIERERLALMRLRMR